jgi:DNA-binding XRE family transcriptional regulator
MSDRSGPDRNRPEWAKPLAPLPEWLTSIEELLKSVDRENAWHGRYPTYAPLRIPGCVSRAYSARRRSDWFKAWRKRRSISRSQAAKILGYDGAGAIACIEARPRNETVRGDKRRQRALAEQRWGEPIPDRVAWLTAWRQRLGIYKRVAAQTLGYSSRTAIYYIETGQFNPSWEKVLIAIDAERAHGAGIALPN